MDLENNLKEAGRIIKEAEAILITAGAGMGVDSGLPDFRGNEGFWEAYPPMAHLGISFVEMANPSWFNSNPKLAWGFYGHRLNLYRQTNPHAGFSQLLNVISNKIGGYFIFTSNVDGQFQKAGFDENSIEECHGSIHHLQCTRPCSDDIWDASNIQIRVDAQSFLAEWPLPKCSKCELVARPNILMFGDWTWIPKRSHLQSSRLSTWLETLHNNNWRLAIIEIGAGEAVATVRYNSENTANLHNATLIRINPRDYSVPSGHLAIPLNAAEGINRIYRLIK